MWRPVTGLDRAAADGTRTGQPHRLLVFGDRALQQLAAVKKCHHCGKHSAAIVKDPQDRFFLVRDGGQDFYAAEVARAVLRRVWRGPDGPHLAAAFRQWT